jgi:hypothetical protein
MMDTDALPPVDVEAIVASYSGNACIRRLLFVAERSDHEALRLDALRAAADILKAGENTRQYAQVVTPPKKPQSLRLSAFSPKPLTLDL